MSLRLKSLTIKNFRTILGNVVIPLDAQVVLVHGANGMGKTSILGALELALTGKVAHIENKPRYTDFFTNFSASTGSIELVTEQTLENQGIAKGFVAFSPGAFNATPALSNEHASFFSERCFLPQAVLGKLLDIYDEQSKNTNSRLTQFVKELLRLEPLDALADGLSPAFNVTRVRKIAPAYKQLEALHDNYEGQSNKLKENIESASSAIRARLAHLEEILLFLNKQPLQVPTEVAIVEVREQIIEGEYDRMALASAVQNRFKVQALLDRLATLGSDGPDSSIAEKEQVEAKFSDEYRIWRQGPGNKINEALEQLRTYNSDISPTISDIATTAEEAIHWCKSEIGRCIKVLEQHKDAHEKLAFSRSIVERSSTRIKELNEHLDAGARDARTLASALAGIVPHVEGEVCPVCSRDYNEINAGSLTGHIAVKIAALTGQAGRLQAFATERAMENQRLSVAQRDLVTFEGGALTQEAVLQWQQRQSSIASINSRLSELMTEAKRGQEISNSMARARQDLDKIRELKRSSAELLPEIHEIVEAITGQTTSTFTTLQEGLQRATLILKDNIAASEARLAHRKSFAYEFDQYERELEILKAKKAEQESLKKKIEAIKKSIREINVVRDTAKHVSTAASAVRSGIVRDVFSGSLNSAWRDLFVRLAPSEQFIPQFKLPSNDDGKVEAVLETLHKSGMIGGAPGAMLSQGNLNTAALTLFLALHLSVPSHLPWLILDDPVQSMDDVHVAQFAALLRTLAKGLGKQLIVAVHERALFDYLTLELSPAFAGDSLLSVEISRNFNGETIADSRYYDFEIDRALPI